MYTGPIISWQIDGKTMETVTDHFLGLQNHCGQWLQPWYKRCLLLGTKGMTNLFSVLKSRDITLLTKLCIVRAMVFPVVMYGCESWAIRRLSAKNWYFHSKCHAGEVPWTARRSNQQILKDINLEYLLEGLMLKLKLQYFGYLIQSSDSLEKTLMLGKTEGRRRGRQRTRWLDDKMWHLGNWKTENFSMCLWYFWLTGDVFIKFSWGVS